MTTDDAHDHDALARAQHYKTSADWTHWEIAINLWPQLRALGITTGTMFGTGIDTDLLAGRPPYPWRMLPDPDKTNDHIAFTANIPDPGQWPHNDIELDEDARASDTPGQFDLGFVNIPFNDISFQAPENLDDAVIQSHQHTAEALHLLRPGGLLVAATHRLFLDGPDARPRQAIARDADLLGATRLPRHAMRSTRSAPLADSPVDVLLLRRRPPDSPPTGADFIHLTPTPTIAPDPTRHINEYYALRPDQCAGNLIPDPDDAHLTTVASTREHIAFRLRPALDRITTEARHTRIDGDSREQDLTSATWPHPTHAEVSRDDTADLIDQPDELDL